MILHRAYPLLFAAGLIAFALLVAGCTMPVDHLAKQIAERPPAPVPFNLCDWGVMKCER